MMEIVVGVAGGIGAGKTTLSTGLSRCTALPVVSASTLVRTLIGSNSSKRADLQAAGLSLIVDRVADFADAVEGEASALGVVVDGPRGASLWMELSRRSRKPAVLLFLDCPASVRLARAQERDGLALSRLRELDGHPVETEGRRLSALATAIIDAGQAPHMVLDEAYRVVIAARR